MRGYALVTITTLIACGTGGGNVTSSSPPEAKMAALDRGSNTAEEAAIRQYGQLLDALDRKCKEDRTQISDMAAKGVQLLAEKNVQLTHLKFMQSMNDSMPPGSETLNLSCAEIAAMLVTMIERP